MSLFQKSLQDVVKGIRGNKHNLAPYISGVISEIKNELVVNDDDTKATAIEKLTYLQLEGYEMSWANFNIVEVMSMPWFGHRHVGYLAASQSFTPDTDVILLTTHLFRKAFSPSSNDIHVMYETGASISCLANICNKDLAMALLKDIYGMLNSARPYTRKKAVLVLYKLFQAWPKALRLSFTRLREKLNDKDPSVRSAAVYVVCELARNNPKNYLSLAPEFFKILTTSSNNWILIKIVKLLGSLVPLEPRLAKKLRDPLHDIITTTPAKSLLYECINTLISGKLTSKSVVSLCMEKLRTFIEDPDQNLKYLGLLGLHKLMKQHLRVVAEHKDLVLDCLEDEDPTIRRRAIDIITRMVSRKNMGGIVRRLLQHLNGAEGDYRNYVMGRIIEICSQENFAFVSDFAWYVDTLLELTVMVGTSRENSLALKNQFIDILVRVKGIRKYATKQLTSLLQDREAAMSGALTNTALSEVLFAAAWAAGEYPHLLKEPVKLLKTILDKSIVRLTPNTQIVYLHAALKICAYVLRRLVAQAEEPADYAPPQATPAVTDAGTGDAKSSTAIVDVMGLIDDGGPTSAVEAKIDDEDNIDVDLKTEIKAKMDEDSKSPTGTVMGGVPLSDWRRVAHEVMDELTEKLKTFTRSNDVEVQERAVCYHRFICALLEKKGDNSSDGPAGSESERVNLLAMTKKDAEGVIVQIVEFFGASEEDKLGLVHPKAQKRVKIPAGLDLDKWIHEPDSDDEDEDLFERKDYSNETWDDLEDFLGTPSSRKKRKAAKRSKNAREQEEREAEMRARNARREKDPFYLKDDDDDMPGIKTLNDDIEVVVPGRKGKKKKKKRRHRQDDDDDDDELPVKYEVAAGPTLDGAESSDEDDNKAKLDVDITTPLQDDEVIPDVSTYPARQKSASDRKDAGKKKKRSKKDKQSKKKDKKGKKKDKRREKEEDEPEAPQSTANILDFGDSPAIKPVAEKKKKKMERPSVLPAPGGGDEDDEYELEVPATAADVTSKKKKKKKDKKSKKDKSKKDKSKKSKKDTSGPAVSQGGAGPTLMNLLDDDEPGPRSEKVESKVTPSAIPQSLFSSGGSPGFRKQLLYKDNAICVYFTTRSERHQPYSLFIDVYMVSLIGKLENVRVELSNAFEGSTGGERPNPSQPIFNENTLLKGKPKMSHTTIEWKTFNGPRAIAATVYYQLPGGANMVRQMANMRLGCASFFLPHRVTLEELKDMMSSRVFGYSATGKITLREMSMQDCLRAISGVLNVQLVRAASGTATYYGRSVRSPVHHMTVYIKAKKGSSKVNVDIRASHDFLPETLLKELKYALRVLPTIP